MAYLVIIQLEEGILQQEKLGWPFRKCHGDALKQRNKLNTLTTLCLIVKPLMAITGFKKLKKIHTTKLDRAPQSVKVGRNFDYFCF